MAGSTFSIMPGTTPRSLNRSAHSVLWGVISVTYSRLSGQSHCLLLIELFQEVLQVRPGKLPLKWFGGLLIEPLESQEALADFLEGSKIIGSKHLPLDN